jgi:hypothetical protein
LATRDCGNKIVIFKLPELRAERQEDNKGRMELRKVEAAFLVVIAGRQQSMIFNQECISDSVRKRHAWWEFVSPRCDVARISKLIVFFS